MSTYADRHRASQRAFCQENAAFLRRLRRRNRFFHSQVNRLISSQVSPGSRIVDIGCADGGLLSDLASKAREAVGIDIDKSAIEDADARGLNAEFVASAIEEIEQPPVTSPDCVVLSMVLDQVYDVYTVLRRIHKWSTPETRVIVVSYSRLWRPLLRLAELVRLKAENPAESYIPRAEVENLLESCEFEVTKRIDGVLAPLYIPAISRFLNRWVAPLPLLRHLGLIHVTVGRPVRKSHREQNSVSIVIAARNEEGHIRELVQRIPRMSTNQEIIFVEGGSTDNTWAAIQAEIETADPESGQQLIALKQPGQGKGDAVRTGFAAATGDILMILDADISVPPEELPRFYEALRMDVCEFANGSRLMYPMEDKAMRFLNMLGNKMFGLLFSFLLGQPVRDTLCGTKVLRRRDYEKIAANRATFGDFDPFGDFDLLFGAAGLGMRIRDVPIHYKERRYGTTNISRFRHGVLLLKMSRIAAARLKFIG